MAHNIMDDKRMMYVGETPWHGLGQKLNNPATAQEAIVAARLDYKVEKQKIYTASGKEIKDKFVTINTENQESLGIVGNHYQIIQNKEAFGFFDALVGEGQAIYHTVGALGVGERIWLLAKLPKNLLIFKEDVVEKYLCLTNSHNGFSSLQVFFTPIRVVCQNTLNASIQSMKNNFAIRHTGNIQTKVSEARRVLGLALDFYSDFDKSAEAMASKKMNFFNVDSYFNSVLDIKTEDEISTKKENVKNRLFHLFENGKGNNMTATRRSLWTAYNSVTEFVDHEKTVKNSDKEKSNRLKSIWFGNGARLKERAFEEAVLLLKK